MRKCPQCGMELPSFAKFCRGCGARLPEETPAKRQQPVQETPVAQSAAQPTAQPAAPAAPKAPDSKKRPWMKIAVLAVVVVAGVLLFTGKIGPKPTCEICDKIAEKQAELQTVLARNADNTLVYPEYGVWDLQVSTLSGELQLLKDHECNMPVRTVKNQEYSYGRYTGTYTGEWKSTAPYNNGTFSGSYREGGTQYDCVYSGEWSAGAPNGVGAMLQRRDYVGSDTIENWTIWRYEGTFANGKLTGSGWSSFESSVSDGIFEYYDGVYDEGFLQGRATYLQYRNGMLYDKGIVEGINYTPISSQRQQALNTLKTAGVLLATGVAAKYFFSELAEAADLTINGTDAKSFKGSRAEAWLEEQHQALEEWSQEWDRKQAQKEVERQQRWEQEKLERKERLEKERNSERLFNEWKTLEAQVKWCETSRYDDERANAEYVRREAEKAKDAYYASK